MNKIFLLLIGLNVCHYLGDYILTNKEMLAAKSKGKPLIPIFEHALVHFLSMSYCFLMFRVFSPATIIALLLQLVSHFVIDVTKGRLNKFECIRNPASKYHWWCFGQDQFYHQVVIILMVYIVTKG